MGLGQRTSGTAALGSLAMLGQPMAALRACSADSRGMAAIVVTRCGNASTTLASGSTVGAKLRHPLTALPCTAHGAR